MAGTALRKRFALDTNLIYDLAEEKDFAHTFIEVFKEKGYSFHLPPTAVQELAYCYQRKLSKHVEAERGLSLKTAVEWRSDSARGR